jgi:hypothetical protein
MIFCIGWTRQPPLQAMKLTVILGNYINSTCLPDANNQYCHGDEENGMINPPNEDKYFSLNEAHLAIFNEEAYQLMIDFQIIRGLARVRLHVAYWVCTYVFNRPA